MTLRYKDQPFHAVTLEPVEAPTVEQIRLFRELSLLSFNNFLEIRRILQTGGFQTFGELLLDQANALSAKLSAVGIPHRIEKTATWRLA